MSTRDPLPPEMRALLARERDIPPLPPAQAARAMARARASLAAGGATTTAPMRARPGKRWAAAAAALLASAAVGAAAYEIRARLAHPPHVASLAHPTPVAARVPPAPAAGATVDDQPLAPEPRLVASGPSPAEAARAELRLLREARAAVARRDFSSALVPIAEHTRKFKNGRLAEEREALRVKALSGLGRTEEARRAADSFRTRFPRSVLLPAVSQMPVSGR